MKEEHTYLQKARQTVSEMKAAKLKKLISEKYKPVPYEERNKVLKVLADAGSYLCHFVVIVASSSFVFSYLFALISSLPYPSVFAGIFTGIVLVGIELAKRFSVVGFFKDFYDPYFDFSEGVRQAGRIAFVIALFSLDIFFAYRGSFDLVTAIHDTPTYQSPTLGSPDEIKSHYEPLIAAAAADAKTFFDSRKWLGKLSDKDSRTHNKLVKAKESLIAEMNTALASQQQANTALLAESKANFRATQLEHDEMLESKGHGLAVLSMCTFPLLILCLWYREKYEFETIIQYFDFNSGNTDLQLQPSQVEPKRGFDPRMNFLSPTLSTSYNVATPATSVGAINSKVTTSDQALDATLLDGLKTLLSDLHADFSNLDNGHGDPSTVRRRVREKYTRLLNIVESGRVELPQRQQASFEKAQERFTAMVTEKSMLKNAMASAMMQKETPIA